MLFVGILSRYVSSKSALQEQGFISRAVSLKVLSVEQDEGDGARVRRSIGRPELRNLDPFLMLDEFNVAPPGGFPDHPHRGFETVTYMLPTSKGIFHHEDFVGHKGVIAGGDLQWMTAGRGIVHAEMPGNNEISHGLQLWVNLAAKDKMCEPAYQELPADKVPKVTIDGVTAHVIAGSALGVTSPVYTRTPVNYLHFELQPNARLQQPIPAGWTSFAYVLTGDGSFGPLDNGVVSDAHHTLALTTEASEMGLEAVAGKNGVSFVLISGQPIREPIVQHGPFVMNSREEIQQTFIDYQTGKNGFEGAVAWESELRSRRWK
jgi:redox-sensitive bicupin YhaK (pirin superfamily)